MKNLMLSVMVSMLLGCGKGSSDSPSAPQIPPTTNIDSIAVSSNETCSKVDVGSGVSLLYQYQSVLYTSGDRLITCSISNSTGEYAHTIFYRSSQAGAQTGTCIVGQDIDALSSGYWTFSDDLVTLVKKTLYTDASSVKNGYTYTFVAANCQTY